MFDEYDGIEYAFNYCKHKSYNYMYKVYENCTSYRIAIYAGLRCMY